MTPAAADVEDCCCTEEDEVSLEVDDNDVDIVDDCVVTVSLVAEGLNTKASPTMRARIRRASKATQRSRFKASEVVGYGVILGACIIRLRFPRRLDRVRSALTMIVVEG